MNGGVGVLLGSVAGEPVIDGVADDRRLVVWSREGSRHSEN